MFHFPLEARNHPLPPEGAVRPNCGNDSIDRNAAQPVIRALKKRETRETRRSIGSEGDRVIERGETREQNGAYIDTMLVFQYVQMFPLGCTANATRRGREADIAK